MQDTPAFVRNFLWLTVFLLFSGTLYPQITVLADTAVVMPDSLSQDTDTLRVEIKPEVPVVPLFQNSDFVNYEEILFINNRTVTDILALSPSAITSGFGSPIYHNTLSNYGSLPGQISVLNNGLEVNDNSFTGFDFFAILSDEIDSVEYIPGVRSFLYGRDNPLAAYNIISKGRVSPLPLTKIHYYEGPFGEAMIDARFNQLFYKRINFTFDVLNRKTGDRFKNSSGSIWSGRASAEYLFSDTWNAGISYFYAKSNINNYNGVHTDSVASYSIDPEEDIYDELNAPILDYYLYEKIAREQIEITLRGKPHPLLHTTMHLYSKNYLREYRDDVVMGVPYLNANFTDKRKGVLLRQEANYKAFLFSLAWQYESAETGMPYFIAGPIPELLLTFPQPVTVNRNIVSSEFSLSPFSGLQLGVFAKLMNEGGTSQIGAGADMQYAIGSLKFYAGVSSYDFEYNYYDFKPTNIKRTMGEIKVSYRNKSTDIILSGYFARNEGTESNVVPLPLLEVLEIRKISGKDIYGAGLLANHVEGVVLGELKLAYNENVTHDGLRIEPLMYIKTGLFYYDILFDSNLVLKTGLEINYRTPFNKRRIDKLINRIGFVSGDTPTAITLDFYTSGKVGGDATVFFLWENLLNQKYYQIYLFPMPARGIVFGINWEMFN